MACRPEANHAAVQQLVCCSCKSGPKHLFRPIKPSCTVYSYPLVAATHLPVFSSYES